LSKIKVEGGVKALTKQHTIGKRYVFYKWKWMNHCVKTLPIYNWRLFYINLEKKHL